MQNGHGCTLSQVEALQPMEQKPDTSTDSITFNSLNISSVLSKEQLGNASRSVSKQALQRQARQYFTLRKTIMRSLTSGCSLVAVLLPMFACYKWRERDEAMAVFQVLQPSKQTPLFFLPHINSLSIFRCPSINDTQQRKHFGISQVHTELCLSPASNALLASSLSPASNIFLAISSRLLQCRSTNVQCCLWTNNGRLCKTWRDRIAGATRY